MYSKRSRHANSSFMLPKILSALGKGALRKTLTEYSERGKTTFIKHTFTISKSDTSKSAQ